MRLHVLGWGLALAKALACVFLIWIVWRVVEQTHIWPILLKVVDLAVITLVGIINANGALLGT